MNSLQASSSAESLEALPRQFGKYTLLRRLASGGMAELFLALHRSVAGFEKLVVIKRILPSMNANKAFIDLLLHEARVAATLSHPNIVQTFDVGQAEGLYFIAMEHIHGEDIQAVIRAMKKKGASEFPIEHTLGIALGVCAGLSYAHERRDLEGSPLGIVHRDVSPRNVVLSFTGDVKIVDFGVAKSSEFDDDEDAKGGEIKGKAPYMSPEQAAGQTIDHRSDVFSLGIILFELTTGKRLFKGASEFETLKLILDHEYPKPSEVKPGYPPDLERVVMRALAKNREDRYASARHMQADLEGFIRNERVAVSSVGLASWMQFLFEEKLAEQRNMLQDIKQLADVVSAQFREENAAGLTGATGGPALASTRTNGPPSKGGALPPLAFGLALGIAGTALFFFLLGRSSPQGGHASLDADHAQMLEGPAPRAAAVLDAREHAREHDQERTPRGTLEIKSTPEGASIWIDGDLRPELTPAKIERLPLAREIQVRLTKEGFEGFRGAARLTDAEPAAKLEGALTARSLTVLVRADQVAPGSVLRVDGEPWKGDRTRIDGLTPGEDHKIVVSAPGGAPRTYTINGKPGETRSLDEQAAGAAPAKTKIGE